VPEPAPKRSIPSLSLRSRQPATTPADPSSARDYLTHGSPGWAPRRSEPTAGPARLVPGS
jgi:hypothetical protein